MPRRALARFKQQVGIRLLRALQRLAGRARVQRHVGLTQRLVGGAGVLDVVRQLANAAAQVLLPGDDGFVRGGRRRDAAVREQLQHLARPQPLARLERRTHTAPVALDQRELRVDLPFIGKKRRAPLRQGERAAGPLQLGERAPQLARGRIRRVRVAEHARPRRVDAAHGSLGISGRDSVGEHRPQHRAEYGRAQRQLE